MRILALISFTFFIALFYFGITEGIEKIKEILHYDKQRKKRDKKKRKNSDISTISSNSNCSNGF